MIAISAKAGLHQAEPWAAAIVRTGIRLAGSLSALRRAAEERAQLLALDERTLQDIGITRVDAIREAERPLWRWYE